MSTSGGPAHYEIRVEGIAGIMRRTSCRKTLTYPACKATLNEPAACKPERSTRAAGSPAASPAFPCCSRSFPETHRTVPETPHGS